MAKLKKLSKKTIAFILVMAIVLLASLGFTIYKFVTKPETINFADYKADKIEYVKDTYSAEKYEEVDWLVITDTVDSTLLKLTLAETVEEVDKILETQEKVLGQTLSIQGKVDAFEKYKADNLAVIKDFDRTLYNNEALKVLDENATKFEKAVAKCETTDEVDTCYAPYLEAFEAVKTNDELAFDKEVNFKTRKVTAKNEINAYKANIIDEYYVLDKNGINNIKEYAMDAIDNAKDVTEIEALITNAKVEIDKYKTKLVQATEYRTGVIETFNKFIADNTDKYFTQQIDELTTLVNAFKTDTLALGTKEEVALVENATKTNIEAVEIKADALVTAKANAVVDIDGMAVGVSEVEIETIRIKKNIAKADVANAKSITEIEVVVANCEAQITAILG